MFVDGPTDSPHRYDGGELCMWWPFLGHVLAHLVREEWWRRTGEWVGDEAPHVAQDGHGQENE